MGTLITVLFTDTTVLITHTEPNGYSAYRVGYSNWALRVVYLQYWLLMLSPMGTLLTVLITHTELYGYSDYSIDHSHSVLWIFLLPLLVGPPVRRCSPRKLLSSCFWAAPSSPWSTWQQWMSSHFLSQGTQWCFPSLPSPATLSEKVYLVYSIHCQ